jgi:hypothetical protein
MSLPGVFVVYEPLVGEWSRLMSAKVTCYIHVTSCEQHGDGREKLTGKHSLDEPSDPTPELEQIRKRHYERVNRRMLTDGLDTVATFPFVQREKRNHFASHWRKRHKQEHEK